MKIRARAQGSLVSAEMQARAQVAREDVPWQRRARRAGGLREGLSVMYAVHGKVCPAGTIASTAIPDPFAANPKPYCALQQAAAIAYYDR